MNRILCLLIFGDFLFTVFSYILAAMLRFRFTPQGFEYLSESALKAFVCAAIILLCSYFAELYTMTRFYRKRELLFRSLSSAFAAFIALSALFYLLPDLAIGRGILALAMLLFVFMQCLWHTWFKMFLKFSGIVPKVIVLGTGEMGKSIGDLIIEHNNNHILAGYVKITEDSIDNLVNDALVLGESKDLYNIARQHNSSKIVISLIERRGCLPINELLRCKFEGIQIEDAVSFYEKLTGKLLVESINPGWFIFSESFRITWSKSFMIYKKRFLDFILSLVGLLLVSPLLPIIYLAIKIESPGPAIFKQIRVGQNEKNFTIYKFRTMCNGAENKTGAIWAQDNDPRITRLGHFLRKTRLDELPQLFNVLKGDMSFSGPRPERPEFVDVLKSEIPYYSKRHSVKPGLTGWAQVKYPYGASVDDALEKLRYDLFYIKNYSIFLDFFIILETFKVVIAGRGAR